MEGEKGFAFAFYPQNSFTCRTSRQGSGRKKKHYTDALSSQRTASPAGRAGRGRAPSLPDDQKETCANEEGGVFSQVLLTPLAAPPAAGPARAAGCPPAG